MPSSRSRGPTHDGPRNCRSRANCLSDFHHREVVERRAAWCCRHLTLRPVPAALSCGVHDSWLRRRYYSALANAQHPPEAKPGEEEFIRVYLSGQTKWGHHEYADSATNGPRGQRWFKKSCSKSTNSFAPSPTATGAFSLWPQFGRLVVAVADGELPRRFWRRVDSALPDPVDFRDFQGVNLYASPPENLYYDNTGGRRPLVRDGDQVMLWFSRILPTWTTCSSAAGNCAV